MNDAHLHIAVNHFPIIGMVFGLGILTAGLVLKNNSVKNTAYFVFIATTIFAMISTFTGEGAEEIVEKLPNVTKEMIRKHHKMAWKFATVVFVTGFFSLISLYFSVKKNSFERYTSIITLVLALVGVFLSIQTATTGGEMRHTEIRKDFVVPADTKSDEDHDK